MSDNKNIDKAFKLFQSKKYDQALATFDEVLGDEEVPSWVRVRIKQFKTMAERQVGNANEVPATLTGVSYFMNYNQFDKAEELLGKLDMGDSDKAFLRSEMAMEQGDKNKAIELLKKAIALDELNLGYALNSPSFSAHLAEDDFAFLRNDLDD